MLCKTRYGYYDCQYYIICIPILEIKLTEEEKNYLQKILVEIAEGHSCPITNINVGVNPDQVHILMDINIDISVEKCINIIKGYSSFLIRKKFKRLKKYPRFWIKGYYVITTGEITDTKINRAINRLQKTR